MDGYDESGEEGNGAEEEELILVRQVSQEVDVPLSLEHERSSFEANLSNVVSSGILGFPTDAAGEDAAARSGDDVSLRAVESGEFEPQAARDNESKAVKLHGSQSFILSVRNRVFRVASTEATK
jgi:hypothetical protein